MLKRILFILIWTFCGPVFGQNTLTMENPTTNAANSEQSTSLEESPSDTEASDTEATDAGADEEETVEAESPSADELEQDMADKTPSYDTAEAAFIEGVRFYQNQKYPDAYNAFRQAYFHDPNNKSAAYNLGITAAKVNRLGIAVGALRRALNLDRSFDAAEEHLKELSQKVPAAQAHSGGSPMEKLKKQVVHFFSIDLVLALLLMALTFTGWQWLKYLGHKKKAFEEDLPLPDLPIKALVGTGANLLLIIIATLVVMELILTRATILPPSQSLFTGPNEKSASIFELNQGQEVIVRKTLDEWSLITYPGGFTGWVPNETIFTHTGWAK